MSIITRVSTLENIQSKEVFEQYMIDSCLFKYYLKSKKELKIDATNNISCTALYQYQMLRHV